MWANRLPEASEGPWIGCTKPAFAHPCSSIPTPRWCLGPTAVELHTGEYANARDAEAIEKQLERLRAATELARDLGLAVHAGHGLTYENVMPVAAIPGCEELNIGHSVISRSVLVGIERSVREMKELLLRAAGA
jgi:pyridoxine 5-phosphate synthase